MKKIIFLLLLLFSPLAFADIGPSPSYSFEINNLADYSEYNFYYEGSVMGFYEVTGRTSLYKFDGHGTLHVVPKNHEVYETINAHSGDPVEAFDDLLLNASVASVRLDVEAGHSVFNVKSINLDNQEISVERISNIPDLIFPMLFLLPFLVLLVIILAVIAIIAFIVKKRKKPSNTNN